MAIFKKLEGNELYLYMNGKPIYKRWLDTGHSKVFDIIAYDKHTLISIKDSAFELNDGLWCVKAKLTLKATEEGGRQTGIVSGLRPNHVFEYDDNGQFTQSYVGEILFEGEPTMEPGEARDVIVRFIPNQQLERYLVKGQIWWLHEGARQIGQAEIL